MGKHSKPEPDAGGVSSYPIDTPGLSTASSGPLPYSSHWQSGDTGGAENHVRPVSLHEAKHRPRTKAAINKSYKANDPDTPVGKKKLAYVGKHSAEGFAAMASAVSAARQGTGSTPPGSTPAGKAASSKTPAGNAFNPVPASPAQKPVLQKSAASRKTVSRHGHGTMRRLLILKASHEGNNKKVLEQMVNK